MTIYNWLIVALWLIFIAYWAVMAMGAKRTIGARFWGREIGLRLGVLVLIVLALRIPAVRHALQMCAAMRPASARSWVSAASCSVRWASPSRFTRASISDGTGACR